MQVVPFGKYKNQPLDVLAQDKGYCEWLAGQGWVAERFPEIHTIIINNFAEPAETPEHNALQLRFLDEGLRLKVSMLVALARRPCARFFKAGSYVPLLRACGAPTFESKSIDVSWEVDIWYPSQEGGHYLLTGKQLPILYHWRAATLHIIVECKPSLGDDYPAVLRFLHSVGDEMSFKVLMVEQYAFRGGTLPQVQAFFQASRVLLLDIASTEALASIQEIDENQLPSPEGMCI